MNTATSRESVAQLLARNNVLLAPMAGITEAPFRGICKRMGAGLTYTEMISVKGLHYNRDSPGVSGAAVVLGRRDSVCGADLRN